MAAVADVCMGELTKLGAKVRARNPFLLKPRKKDAVEGFKDESSASSTTVKSPAIARNEECLPETTILLLLDRFAPC